MNSAVLALTTWVIALIAAGCVLIVGAIVAVVLVFYFKKRHEANLSMEYLLKLGEKAAEKEPQSEAATAEDAAPVPQSEPTQKITTSFFGFRTFLFNKSFTAKLIQLDDVSKEWYSALKNELLSYKKVRDRMSWKRESFRLGRKCVARFAIRGKRLCLLLNADAAQYAGTKYRVEDISHIKSSADTPCLYRVKTARRAQYAKDLIADVMKALGVEKTARAEVDYVLPYEETEELIARGLIKKIEVVIPAKEGDEELNTYVEDEATVASLGLHAAATPFDEDEIDLFDDEELEEINGEDEAEEEEPEQVPEAEDAPEESAPEEPAEEPEEEIIEAPEAEEIAEEAPAEEIAVSYDEYIEEDFEDEEEEAEELEEIAEADEGDEAEETEEPAEALDEPQEESASEAVPEQPVHYNKSFTAKVIQLSNTSKHWYSKLKNEILSYANVCDVMSWKRESFRFNQTYTARFIVRGKTLCLLLAIDPQKYGEAKYKVQDVSKRNACEDTPCMIRLKNEKSVKNAIHLISEAMRKAGAKKSAHHVAKDYYIPYKTTSQLIEQGLVRSSKK